ncbi:MAG: polyphosphate kinase 2 [Deltaproteobacteria bacterium HGW-Deltaproteobacteria-24]|nr:MAG: polyphosphate kinase 2 [Deltaproteobacteria bacterium HGW-Deltaproteobacteria-24]
MLTKKIAISLLQKFKTSLELDDHIEAKDITINAKTHEVKFDKTIAQLQEENSFLRSVLGEEYRTVDIDVLKDGIQKIYDAQELKDYQIELIKLQDHLEKQNQRMIILFEGRDASGKGGAIRRITRYMNNKHYRVVALGKPTETQRNQWFMQKYIEHFPTGGEIVLFDRSWYNRAMVEPIFGFCTQEEHEIFMEDIVNFEQDLVRQGMILIKLYFSVSKAEQKRRFDRRINDPLRQWKFSEVDMQAQDLWGEFSEKKYEMLKRTSSRSAPWHIVRSDNKHLARLEAMKIILNSVDYEGRNFSLNFEAREDINISIQKELLQMRKSENY